LKPTTCERTKNIAMGMRMRGRLSCCGDFEDADLRVADGIGVVVHVHAFHIGLAFREVEMFDVMLLPAVNVNGFFVEEYQRARKIPLRR